MAASPSPCVENWGPATPAPPRIRRRSGSDAVPRVVDEAANDAEHTAYPSYPTPEPAIVTVVVATAGVAGIAFLPVALVAAAAVVDALLGVHVRMPCKLVRHPSVVAGDELADAGGADQANTTASTAAIDMRFNISDALPICGYEPSLLTGEQCRN